MASSSNGASTNGSSADQPNTNGFAKLTRDNSAVLHQQNSNNSFSQKRRKKSLESKLNLAEIVKMLYRGRWIILLTFVIVFAVTVYQTYSKPFVYSSWARMFIEKKPEMMQLKLSAADDDHSVPNQITFFKSHVVSQHVAHLLLDYAQGRRTEIDSLFLEYFGSKAAIPNDRSKITIIKMVDNPKLPVQPGIPDEAVLEARASTNIKIDADAGNDYLIVTAEGYTPQDAAFLTNIFMVVYAKDNLARSRANSESLKSVLASQVKHSYDTLNQVESQLKDYLRESNGLSIEQRAGELTAQLEQTKLKYNTLVIDMAQRSRIYSDLVANLDTVQKVFFQNLTLEPAIALLEAQIAGLEADLLTTQATNSAMNPLTKKYFAQTVNASEQKITQLKENLRAKAEEQLRTQVIVVTDGEGMNSGAHASDISQSGSVRKLREAILTTKLKLGEDSLVAVELSKLIANLDGEISQMPDKIIRSGQLKRSEGSAERLYTQMEDRYMDAWLAEQGVFGSVRLEDPAAIYPTPIRPNRQASILTGALIGLGIGISVVVLLSFLDSTVRSPDEVESHGLHVLATIPIIQPILAPKGELPVSENGATPKFTAHRVAFLDPRSSIAEAYRSLRTSIQFATLDKDIRTIAITSSVPQEGKSTTSANLAIVMAQMGKRTLLVDTDLRRPTVHSVFGVPREPGLTNILFDKISLDEAVHETDVPNLSLLTCGIIPPNPAELLGSEKMRHLIDTLQDEYDMVIFDTPPVVAVTDSLLLGMKVDAMIVIARADSTKADALLRSVDTVERSGARLLGIVLNNFNVANAYGAYYRYYQYYNYYSHDQPVKKSVLNRFRKKTGKVNT
jgi:capsular exopolysaccharide synthesis family protein